MNAFNRKATPKLQYDVLVQIRGERVSLGSNGWGRAVSPNVEVYEELVAWFGCHNTDCVSSDIRFHLDALEDDDCYCEVAFTFNARMEDLDPACEQLATATRIVTISEHSAPEKVLFKFQE